MWKRNGLAGTARTHCRLHCRQAVAGHHVHNQELTQHGRAAIDLLALPGDRAFRERYIRELGERVPADGNVRSSDRHPAPAWLGRIPAPGPGAGAEPRRAGPAPWPVVAAAHGRCFTVTRLRLPSGCCSCSVLHCMHCSWRAEQVEQQLQVAGAGFPGASGSSTFWFESMQNWQSEFCGAVPGCTYDLPAAEGLTAIQAGRSSARADRD